MTGRFWQKVLVEISGKSKPCKDRNPDVYREGRGADNDGDEQVEDDSEKSLQGPRILVRDAVYPGAVIGIGHSVRIIDTRIDHCILREVDDEIRIFPL